MNLDDFLANPESRFATVAMTDFNGLLRGQMVSVRSLKGIARNGMGMSPVTFALDPTDVVLNIPGVSDETADFHDDPLVIDPSTARRLPWSKPGHDLLVLSNYSGGTADLCPRTLLSHIFDRAGEAGFLPRYGMELEYTLFDETPESAREKGYRNLRTATMHKSHDLVLYQVQQTEWYEALADMCETLGIDLAKMHEEIGGGFLEACIAANTGLGPADQLVLLKNFIRALAQRQGRCVTYMPRWTEDADSQSIHLHVSLVSKDGNPVFHDASGHKGMSKTFLHFIGGLQRYIGEMTLIFQPTVNSYRRFAPGTFAPPRSHLGFREPHDLLPRGGSRCGFVAGGKPASGGRHQSLSHHSGDGRGRPGRHPGRDRAAAGSGRQRLCPGGRRPGLRPLHA